MTEAEVAWLAGLLEGEGCFSSPPGKARVICAMTDRDVIERCLEITGVGNLKFRKRYNPDRKDQWVWDVSRLRDASAIMRVVRPLMGLRRGAAIDAVLAQLVDPRPKARTHCKNGHEFTPETTYPRRGYQDCRICRHNAARRYKARLKVTG